MRIRTIKPEFWRSDDITKLSREDRLLFIGLWSYVDDNGVGIDDYRQIGADLFALEDDQKEVREFVREGLATLSRGLLITRYVVDGKAYFYINTWPRHQRVDRPNQSRYPLPPDPPEPSTSTNANARDTLATPSRDVRETPSSGTGEQGNRGTGEQGKTSPPRSAQGTDPDRFAEFYDAYPRHVARKTAEKAWKAAIKNGADPQTIIEAAERYAASRHGQDPTFTKHPSTWLNGGCWADEPDPTPLRLVSGDQPLRPSATQRAHNEVDAAFERIFYRTTHNPGDPAC